MKLTDISLDRQASSDAPLDRQASSASDEACHQRLMKLVGQAKYPS